MHTAPGPMEEVMKHREIENRLLYSVFARNHSQKGTLKEVEADLERIRNLGTDILWLLPVQPSGLQDRKGTDGSPYAIQDYRAIDPNQGTWEDLKSLTDKAHELGIKVIVDVVYTHTSPDSVLVQQHPESFFTNAEGKRSSLVEDWSDIVDLDYRQPALWDYQIETLKQFAAVVDGFRCDVASRVPAAFWKQAREACETMNPDMFWLAESCHLPFVKFCRDQGRVGESESALSDAAFDVLYDYDAFPDQLLVMENKAPVSQWTEALIRQDAILPPNHIKLRYLENHDQPRAMACSWSDRLWKNWTALLFTLKGLPMLYHGQEQKESHLPSIFDQDPISWNRDPEAEDWIRHCKTVRNAFFEPGSPVLYEPDDETGSLAVDRNGCRALFQLQEKADRIPAGLPDGEYRNLFTDRPVRIVNGIVDAADLPLLVQDPLADERRGL